MKSNFQVVETTDLRTRVKSFKIYRRNALLPLVIGLVTREEAEAKLREIEENER